jgi:hypothetical protein
MRDDLLHFAILIAVVGPMLALGLLLGFSDEALGVTVLGGIAVGLLAGDAVSNRRASHPAHRIRAPRVASRA